MLILSPLQDGHSIGNLKTKGVGQVIHEYNVLHLESGEDPQVLYVQTIPSLHAVLSRVDTLN
jgi:hypothetical protein